MATLEEWLSTTEPGLQADSCFFFLPLVSSGEKSLLINHFNFGCYRLEWYAVLFAFFSGWHLATTEKLSLRHIRIFTPVCA